MLEIPVVGHRPRRAAVVARRAAWGVFGRERSRDRRGGDRLPAADEDVDRGRIKRRIVADPGGEAETFRLDRLRGGPGANPAGFDADRQDFAGEIDRENGCDHRRAGERPAHRLARGGARRVDPVIARRRARQRRDDDRCQRPEIPAPGLRLQRPRPLGPAAIFVPRLLDHRIVRTSVGVRFGAPLARLYRTRSIAPAAPVRPPPSAPGRDRRECRRCARCRSRAGRSRPSRRSRAALRA